MGTSSIHGPFSMAILNNQRVICCNIVVIESPVECLNCHPNGGFKAVGYGVEPLGYLFETNLRFGG